MNKKSSLLSSLLIVIGLMILILFITGGAFNSKTLNWVVICTLILLGYFGLIALIRKFKNK